MSTISPMQPEIASCIISNYSVEPDKYSGTAPKNLLAKGKGTIYTKNEMPHLHLTVNFNNSNGCKVFLGSNARGRVRINFSSNDSIVWVGDNTKLNGLGISTYRENDLIAIGNETSANSSCTIISGRGSLSPSSSVLIGDDCMFSNEVVIRNTDGHPIISRHSLKPVNEPIKPVIIEPHVWIGERVSITKNVSIGACSIIALGSVVTRDVPRFSVAGGSPAKIIRVDKDRIWSRANSRDAIEKALLYAKTFDKNE